MRGGPIPSGGFVSTYTDITERKRTEAEVVQQKTILESVLDNMDQGISMFDAEFDSLVLNDKYFELLEFPKDRFEVGANGADFLRYNAERGEYGPGDVEQQVAERLALASKFEPHSFERQRPDGTIIEIRGKPLAAGGILTVYTDLTERRRAEAVARAYQENLRRLVEDAALGVVVNSLQGILFANRAAYDIVGMETPDELGTDFDMFSLILEEDRPILAERLQRCGSFGPCWIF